MNPIDWSPDVTVALIIQMGSIVVATIAAIASIITVKISMALKTQSHEIKDQVQNSHGTNLRNDIDAIAVGMRNMGQAINVVNEKLDHNRERADRVHSEFEVEFIKMWNEIAKKGK